MRRLRRPLTQVGFPGTGEGIRRRRRQGHARGARPRVARRSGTGRAARSAGGIRRRHALRRAAGAATSSHRDAGVRRRAGNVVHLFERECSIQRRHQKIDRGEPFAGVDAGVTSPDGRGGNCRGASCRLSQRRHDRVSRRRDRRRGALLFSRDEHAPSGRTSGHRGGHGRRSRSRAIAGRHRASRLPWSRRSSPSVATRSNARVYAEDPSNGFLPQAGRLCSIASHPLPGIRIDTGVEEGTEVPVQYDPMLAKVIASGESRPTAASRVRAALRAVPDSWHAHEPPVPDQSARAQRVRAGNVHTGFVEEHLAELLSTSDAGDIVTAVAAVRA